MQKVIVAVVCVLMLVAFAGPISSGITTWRTDSVTQTASVTTGGGVTTGAVVLTRALFNDDPTTNITSLSSSISETPIAGAYTAGTQSLAISNLTESQTRTITIVYKSEKNDTYLQTIGPFLLILIFGGILAAIVMNLFKKGKR